MRGSAPGSMAGTGVFIYHYDRFRFRIVSNCRVAILS
jgi:hypothetical protein